LLTEQVLGQVHETESDFLTILPMNNDYAPQPATNPRISNHHPRVHGGALQVRFAATQLAAEHGG
jgi:hypothetical protein